MTFDRSKRAPFEPIRIANRRATRVAGRDTLSLGFSCRVPIQDMVGAALAALEAYLAAIPADALRWSLIGSSSSTITPLKLARARSMLGAKRRSSKPIYFFLHGGEGDPDDAPAWLFLCNGATDVEPQTMPWGELRRTTQLELRFPSDYLWQRGVDRIVELAASLCRLLPLESGFGSIAVSWSPLVSTISQDALRPASRLVSAHHGLDLQHDAFTLGGRCRGAQWLTALGPALLDILGGRSAVVEALDPGVGVIEAGEALILRAGEVPLPDLSSRDRALRASVARVVAPVTLFECDNRAFDDPKSRDAWLRRFMAR